jgi:ribulose-5-phosphate 4-epimerase/fuculose-1-phosphate aldolase
MHDGAYFLKPYIVHTHSPSASACSMRISSDALESHCPRFVIIGYIAVVK